MKISKPSSEGWIGSKKTNTFENYQLEEYNAALSKVKNFRTAIDIGANIGIMSYRMVNNFNKVYAFEPLFYDHIKENVKNSKLEVYPYAIGSEEKIETMRVGVYHSGGSNIVKEKENNVKYKDVKVVTIDSFNFTDVDFIKIDVELYEWYAILGAKITIEKYKPTILIELTPNNPHYQDIIDFLEGLSYKRKIVGYLDSVFYQ